MPATVCAAARHNGWVVTSSIRSPPTLTTRPSRSDSRCSLPERSMAGGSLLWFRLAKPYHAETHKPSIPIMTDSLGFRKKFAVIAPSTNTSVQPEFDAMAPRGVTNHFGRISIPNAPIYNDDEFNQLMDNIRKDMLQTVDRVM